MRILLTGGAGFIGSNLAQKLVQNHFNIDVVDNLSGGNVNFVPKKILDEDRLMVVDFSSPCVLEKIKQKSYDVVFHLAAQPRVSYSVEKPFETHQNNVTASIKLIDACRGNIKRFVFASTCAIYGDAKKLPVNEESQPDCQSPYALQKLIVEDYLRLFDKLYGFDSVNLRFFNVFGKNQLGDSPYSTVVSAWINAILSGQSMRFDGDGTQTRDMCHVDNVVDACLKAATSKKSFSGDIINVGSGERISNNEIHGLLLEKFPHAKTHQAPRRPGDVMHTHADLKTAEKLLGYRPLVGFKDGLNMTTEWYQDNWEKIRLMKDE